MISIPAKEQNVVFKEDVIEKIYELSRGIPYCMQIIVYRCFEEADDDTVTMDEFKTSISKLLLRNGADLKMPIR